jgi:hypothetical protein
MTVVMWTFIKMTSLLVDITLLQYHYDHHDVIIIIIIIVIILLLNSHGSVLVYSMLMEIHLLWSYVNDVISCILFDIFLLIYGACQIFRDFENPAFIYFSWSLNSCCLNLRGLVFKFCYFVFPDIDITLCIMICYIPRHFVKCVKLLPLMHFLSCVLIFTQFLALATPSSCRAQIC